MKGMSGGLRSVMLRPEQLKAIHAKKNSPGSSSSRIEKISDIKMPKCRLSDIKVPKRSLSDIPGPGTLADVPGFSELKKEVGR